jgi:hypothetical protein
VTGSPARALTSELQDVDVPWAAANAVFRSHTIPHTIAQTIEALPRVAQLPPDCLGALVTLVYNRGAAFNMTDARHAEMRAIRDDVASGQLDDVPRQLRLMKRLWANDSNMAGLVARRESEAVLFEDALRGMSDGDQTRSLIS